MRKSAAKLLCSGEWKKRTHSKRKRGDEKRSPLHPCKNLTRTSKNVNETDYDCEMKTKDDEEFEQQRFPLSHSAIRLLNIISLLIFGTHPYLTMLEHSLRHSGNAILQP